MDSWVSRATRLARYPVAMLGPSHPDTLYLYTLYLSICLSVYLSTSVYLSIYLSVYLPICLSICLSVDNTYIYLSTYRSIDLQAQGGDRLARGFRQGRPAQPHAPRPVRQPGRPLPDDRRRRRQQAGPRAAGG